MESNGAGLARASIEERLGHTFGDRELLERALTHGSAAASDNERLEFLGDSILAFIVAEHLFHLYPEAAEGDLTRMRARIVRRESLAAAARDIGLGPALRLSPGERRSGGGERDSILADAFEALMGALWLDSDLPTCRERILATLAKIIEAAVSEGGRKDPKTRLQEYLQGRGKALPDYRIAAIEGAKDRRRFIVHCKAEGMIGETTGSGTSRRRAEQSAAQSALARLGVGDDSPSRERRKDEKSEGAKRRTPTPRRSESPRPEKVSKAEAGVEADATKSSSSLAHSEDGDDLPIHARRRDEKSEEANTSAPPPRIPEQISEQISQTPCPASGSTAKSSAIRSSPKPLAPWWTPPGLIRICARASIACWRYLTEAAKRR